MIALDGRAAVAFLELLDAGAEHFTFQTFSDRDPRPELTRVIHGSLKDVWGELAKLNRHGAGIFVTINETDGQGRRASNIVRVRLVFVDLDGAPLPLPTYVPLSPHIVVRTSPGRHHLYWLVSGVALNDFSTFQTFLAETYGGDPTVKDLPRVMRLPGFLHQKRKPFLVRLEPNIYNAIPWGYTVHDALDAWPELRRRLDERQKPPERPPLTVTPGTKYVQAAVDGELERIHSAPVGARNDTLNRAAFSLGQLVGAGLLDRASIAQDLLHAARSARSPLPASEAIATIERALAAGMRHPREGVA